MAKPPKPAGSPPGPASLREAALRHLSRFAATESGLVRVLDRAILRWAARAAVEGREIQQEVMKGKAAARTVAAALVEAGAVDDATFAASRSARLTRAGRSRCAVAAHLAAKGVAGDVAAEALPDADTEFAAAVAFTRRRRMGPFRPDPSAETRQRDLSALARAGFPRAVAERALDLRAEDAEAAVLGLRRG